MLAHSFLMESSLKLLVTRMGIKARTSSISSLRFPFWPIYNICFLKWDLTLAHWTQVSHRCPLGYLLYLLWSNHAYVKLDSAQILWNYLVLSRKIVRTIPILTKSAKRLDSFLLFSWFFLKLCFCMVNKVFSGVTFSNLIFVVKN